MNRIRLIVGSIGIIWALSTGWGCASTPEKDEGRPEDAAQTPADATESPDRERHEADAADADSFADPDPESSGATGDPDAITDEFNSRLSAALEEVQSGNRSSAVDQLQALVSEPDGGFLAAFNLGVLYENEGDYANAARRYSQSLAKNPQFSPALLNLVRLYLRLDQPRDAAKLAEKYADARPGNMDHRAIALQVDLHAGKHEEVIRKAKRILRRDEKNVEAMLAMAEANIQLQRGELAEAILERAMELRPNRAEIYFKFAKIRQDEDRITEAIAVLERALQHRQNYPEAHNNLGVLYHEAGDYDAAVREFRTAIGDYPDYKEAYLNLGNSLKSLQKYTKAEKAFSKALDIDAGYADALFNLGVLYLDSDIDGMDTIDQMNTSIDYFTKYQSTVGGRLPEDDPAEKYIAEARKAIETEEQRQEMMRQAQMQADDDGNADEGDDSSDAAASAEGE